MGMGIDYENVQVPRRLEDPIINLARTFVPMYFLMYVFGFLADPLATLIQGPGTAGDY
jgi:hypothetical protein